MSFRYGLLRTLGIVSLVGGIYAGGHFMKDKSYLERNTHKFEFRREGNFTVVPYEKFEVENSKRKNGLLAIIGIGAAALVAKKVISISSNPEFQLKNLIRDYNKKASRMGIVELEMKNTENRIYEGTKIIKKRLENMDSNSLRKINEINLYESRKFPNKCQLKVRIKLR